MNIDCKLLFIKPLDLDQPIRCQRNEFLILGSNIFIVKTFFRKILIHFLSEMKIVIMFSKTVILLFCCVGAILGDSTLAPTQKPDPNARPLPNPDALPCINAIKNAGVSDKCRTQAMNTWDPIKRGQEMGSLRESCCEAYGEVDCILNATQNGGYCKGEAQQAMLNHQRTLFGWLQKGMCLTIKYHSGNCDPDQYIREQNREFSVYYKSARLFWF